MAQTTRDQGLLALAKRGAQAQLNDLMHEVKMLFELFPHLRDSVDPDELPLLFLLKQGSPKARANRSADSAEGPRAMKARPSPATGRARKKTPTKS